MLDIGPLAFLPILTPRVGRGHRGDSGCFLQAKLLKWICQQLCNSFFLLLILVTKKLLEQDHQMSYCNKICTQDFPIDNSKLLSSKTKIPEFLQTLKIIEENPKRVSILVSTQRQTHFPECWNSNAHFNRLQKNDFRDLPCHSRFRRSGNCGRASIFLENFPGFAFWTSDFGDICWTNVECEWPLDIKGCWNSKLLL